MSKLEFRSTVNRAAKSDSGHPPPFAARLIKKRTEVSAVVVGLLAVLAIDMTGTVAALGDTLFPVPSLRVSILRILALTVLVSCTVGYSIPC